MKLFTQLTRVAALGFASFLAAVTFGGAAVPALSLATGAFLALLATHDYAPQPRSRIAVAATMVEFPATIARRTEAPECPRES
jgi:hypothetical protein